LPCSQDEAFDNKSPTIMIQKFKMSMMGELKYFLGF
jgi:hypothetical protein